MRNLLLTISFVGTNYHGFQVQKNALSVCEVFQDALEKAFSSRGEVKGCSRTDSGVHAREYCLSVKLGLNIPCDRLAAALNDRLPPDIVVLDAREVGDDFHARYDCKAKQYVYDIHNSRLRDPFSHGLCYLYGFPLDERMLDAQAKQFVGSHDFAAFRSAGGDVSDTVRTIHAFDVARQGEHLLFTVTGDGFLYNMVRIMVGTLLFIAMGKIEPDSIGDIIARGDRARAGKTMPAHGLYLNKVLY